MYRDTYRCFCIKSKCMEESLADMYFSGIPDYVVK